jgi:hypothetical protein
MRWLGRRNVISLDLAIRYGSRSRGPILHLWLLPIVGDRLAHSARAGADLVLVRAQVDSKRDLFACRKARGWVWSQRKFQMVLVTNAKRLSPTSVHRCIVRLTDELVGGMRYRDPLEDLFYRPRLEA